MIPFSTDEEIRMENYEIKFYEMLLFQEEHMML